MKKSLVRILLCVFVIISVMASLPLSGVCAKSTDDGIVYETYAGEVTITGYTGYSQNLTIPSRIKALPVTAIGENAFSGNYTLTCITLSSGVKEIGTAAFSGCVALKSIAIPESVDRIEGFAFSGCTSLEDIYFEGIKSRWNNIDISDQSTDFKRAKVHLTTTTDGKASKARFIGFAAIGVTVILLLVMWGFIIKLLRR